MTERMSKLQALLADDPENPFLHFAMAKEHEGLDDREQAMATYLHLKSIAPNYVGLYYHLGKLQERMEDFDGAIATYTKGMEIAKAQGDMHAHGELSTAHWEVSED